jgi:hypothetical protein
LAQFEIDICSHIVRSVCGKHMYSKFKFDYFFPFASGQTKVHCRCSVVRVSTESQV